MGGVMRHSPGAQPSSATDREFYPNTYAGGTEYPDPGDGIQNSNADNGVKCAQCGYPIPDRQRAKNCPNCSSDNFEGATLSI